MKMREFSLGRYADSAKGNSFQVTLQTLIEKRLLVQASSGGGKTHAMKALLEATHGHVQHIVLDIEGEFGVLRKKYDYLLIGDGGDGIGVEPEHAEILARKILELNVSVIANLFELPMRKRILFVKNFLNSMLNSPKNLWHPCLIILDEAHIFAPEKAPSEAADAVINMASRGRKRQFCLIPATQRPAKLSKDVTAECGNKLIGLANMDIDRDRAAKELGFSDASAKILLRDLAAGEFYAVGPAFHPGVKKVIITPDVVQEKVSGEKLFKAPPASSQVKGILAKLADFSVKAEEEIQTATQMKATISRLERELKFERELKQIPVPKFDEGKAKTAIEDHFAKIGRQIHEQFSKVDHMALVKALAAIQSRPVGTGVHRNAVMAQMSSGLIKTTKIFPAQAGLPKCESAILSFCMMRPDVWFSKEQIGALTGYSPNSGGFNNALSQLSSQNLIARQSGRYSVRSGDLAEIQQALGGRVSEVGEPALRMWLNKLGKCAQTIFRELDSNRERLYSKEELGQITGYASTSGGFNNALSQLATLGLLARENGGVRFNPELLEAM